MKLDNLSDSEALALLSAALENKSPDDFAKWCGCSIEIAIGILSAAIACKMVSEFDA